MSNTGIPFGMGPFVGGLNQRDSRYISEDELASCINFDIEDDGTLLSRKALIKGAAGLNPQPNPCTNILGYDESIDAIFAQFNTGTFNMYAWQGGVWFSRTAGTNNFIRVIVYNGFIYYIALAGQGFREPVGFGGAITAIATMPLAHEATMYRDRLWLSKDNTLYYSATTDPTNWPGANFIKVGDSSRIYSIVTQGDTLLIFKQNSTWRFDFTANPGVDGYLQQVNSEIGANNNATNAWEYGYSTCILKNVVYVINQYSVYRYYNGNFEDIGSNLLKSTAFKHISVIDDNKIMVTMEPTTETTPQDARFIFNVDNETWTEYRFGYDALGNAAAGITRPQMGPGGVAHFGAKIQLEWLTMSTLDYSQDAYPTNFSVPIPCSLKTKEYDANDPIVWKKLYWFGFEMALAVTGASTTTATLKALAPTDTAGAAAAVGRVLTADGVPKLIKSNIRGARFRISQFELSITRVSTGSVRVFAGRYVVNLKTRVQKSLV